MRETMIVIVGFIDGKQCFHFTEQPLAGKEHSAWFSVLNNNLFQSIEKVLIEKGVAHNLSHLSELRKNNETSSDYMIIYNITPRKWVEVIPLIGGSYHVPCSDDGLSNFAPCLFDSFEEAQAEHDKIAFDYLEQMAKGEREEGAFWDGEIYECDLNGDEITLYNNGVLFDVVNWKESL